MNSLFMFAEIVHPSGIGDSFAKFGVNIYDLVSQAICFLILAYVLNRFVFRVVMRTIEQRRKDADEAAINIEKIRKFLKEAEDKKADIIRSAHEQAEKLIMETKADTALLREEEIIQTEKLVAQLLAKAREESLLNQKKIKMELKQEIAEMIVQLTGVLTEKNLKEPDKARLMDSALKAMTPEFSVVENDITK